MAARDRQIVRLEDQLASLAGDGDDAKRAAAQVLVRKLHEMRREEEERLADKAAVSSSESAKSLASAGPRRPNNTQIDVLQGRIVALQNELRQMREEGGVSLVVAARQAARAAQMEAAEASMKLREMEVRSFLMRFFTVSASSTSRVSSLKSVDFR